MSYGDHSSFVLAMMLYEIRLIWCTECWCLCLRMKFLSLLPLLVAVLTYSLMDHFWCLMNCSAKYTIPHCSRKSPRDLLVSLQIPPEDDWFCHQFSQIWNFVQFSICYLRDTALKFWKIMGILFIFVIRRDTNHYFPLLVTDLKTFCLFRSQYRGNPKS